MKGTMLSDQTLLEQYQQGNREAISQLLERHSRRLRDYMRMLVKDNDVADDLMQEVLIKVVKVIDEGRYTIPAVVVAHSTQQSVGLLPRKQAG